MFPTMVPLTETHSCCPTGLREGKGVERGILFYPFLEAFYVLLQVCLWILATGDLDFGAVRQLGFHRRQRIPAVSRWVNLCSCATVRDPREHCNTNLGWIYFGQPTASSEHIHTLSMYLFVSSFYRFTHPSLAICHCLSSCLLVFVSHLVNPTVEVILRTKQSTTESFTLWVSPV